MSTPPKEVVEVTEVISQKLANPTNLKLSPAILPPSSPTKANNAKIKTNQLQYDSFGFGIEEVGDSSDEENEINENNFEDGQPARLRRSNAIKRAFNKIRLFF